MRGTKNIKYFCIGNPINYDGPYMQVELFQVQKSNKIGLFDFHQDLFL